MYEDARYALDKLFLFMLVVSVAVFVLSLRVEISETAIHTVEYIDFAVLGGYYFFFGHGIYNSKRKLRYMRKHWIMLLLLLLPFIPLARLARLAQAEKVMAIGSNTIWHILDEIGLL